jgi:pimeloyl-ACP methyl ester carboxylesterase
LHSHIIGTALALSAICLVVGGCGHPNPELSASKVEDQRNGSGQTAQWVAPKTRPALSDRRGAVIVFVHGIFGSSLDSWRNDQTGVHFYDLVANDPALGNNFDIYAYGYPSRFLSSSFSIQEAAEDMSFRLEREGIFTYKKVVIVAHSMGGLIAMRMLLTQPETFLKRTHPRVSVMVQFGTPHEGANIAAFARHFLPNAGLPQMLPRLQSDISDLIDRDWSNDRRTDEIRPELICGYEMEKTYGDLIVDKASATRGCSRVSAIPADHLTIVKPANVDSPAYVLLSVALSHVMGPVPETLEFDRVLSDLVQNFQPEATITGQSIQGPQEIFLRIELLKNPNALPMNFDQDFYYRNIPIACQKISTKGSTTYLSCEGDTERITKCSRSPIGPCP